MEMQQCQKSDRCLKRYGVRRGKNTCEGEGGVVVKSGKTCATIQENPGSRIHRIQGSGSRWILDPGLAFRLKIQWILDLVHRVLAGSCGSWILFRKIAAGFWGSWILLRENSLAEVGLRP